MTFKRIEGKPGEITLGLLWAAYLSMVIVGVCILQMIDYGYLQFGWWAFFAIFNFIYVGKYVKPDIGNGMIVASGPVAFYFWVIVDVWNKYIAIPKPVKLTKKLALDEINKGVDDANKKIPGGAKAHPVYDVSMKPCNVTIKSHYDILRELNDEITEKLVKFDIFDIEVPIIRMEQFIQIVKERNLDWRPTDFIVDGKETVVVGKKGAAFDKFEEDR